MPKLESKPEETIHFYRTSPGLLQLTMFNDRPDLWLKSRKLKHKPTPQLQTQFKYDCDNETNSCPTGRL